MKLSILQYPNEHLDKPTIAVEKVTPELIQTAKDIYETMRASGGIGLAANQVGLDMSLIVIQDNGGMLAIFNPVIIHRSKEQEYSSEGCLSFNNVWRIIKRPLEVTIKYRDINNKRQYQVFKGIQARCIIHEVDHLLGRTFLKYDEKKLDN
jgi:peptide deformylase